MAGRPKGAQARTEYVQFRITAQGRAIMDKARGTLKISDYIRGLIEADAAKKGLR